MVSLPLEVALSVLVIAMVLMCVQLVIMTVELAALRRDVQQLLRTTASLNHAVNPWAGEDEPTEPGRHTTMRPPRKPKPRRWGWFPPIRPPKS
jgi:hypothetical protein